MGVVHLHRRARAGFPIKNLGPTMAAAGCGDKKIVVWDHNRVAVFLCLHHEALRFYDHDIS